jgi:hypothetical protein
MKYPSMRFPRARSIDAGRLMATSILSVLAVKLALKGAVATGPHAAAAARRGAVARSVAGPIRGADT